MRPIVPQPPAQIRKIIFWYRNRSGLQKFCFYCGHPIGTAKERAINRALRLKTTDHIIPRVHDGTKWGQNKIQACDECNQAKGWKTLDRYRTIAVKGGKFFGEIKYEEAMRENRNHDPGHALQVRHLRIRVESPRGREDIDALSE